MKFAAGLTVSGIVGFLVLEVLKLLLPAIAAGVMAFLALAVKVLLIGAGLFILAVAIGIGVFFYKRAERARAEI